MLETLPAEEAGFLMLADDAKAQLRRIKEHWQALWFELRDFHERKGWVPLGYGSFSACVEAELGLSHQRASQILDAAIVREQLSTQPGLRTSDNLNYLTERHARELKPLQPAERAEIARRVDFQNTTVRELHQVVREVKQGTPPLMAVHFSSATPEWYTPPEIVEAVVRFLGIVDLDPCSNSGVPNVPARAHFTEEDDGLQYDWNGRIYMNPPYGREIGAWVEKLVSEHKAGRVPEAIALVPARTDTEWFAQFRDCAVCLVNGRLKFSGAENSAPFPSALVYLGRRVQDFARSFAEFGDTWLRVPVLR